MPASVAIVVEWENALLADAARARRMLSTLGKQAQAYARSHNTRFDLLIAYDPDEIDVAVPRSCVDDELDPTNWPGEIRYIAARGLHYYEQKTLGAASSDAETVIFLDSDVIPDAGWLGHLLDAMDRAEVQVVGGHTYLAAEHLLDRLFSGFWFFEPNPKRSGVNPAGHFYANNVAFKRGLLERYGFDRADSYRGQCVELARRLRADGVPIWRAAEAAVSHPAPDGLRHAFFRAVCQGHDNVYWRRRRPLGWLHASPLGGAVRLLRSIGKTGTTVLSRARPLGLDPLTAIGSFAFGAGFALVIYGSEIVAYVAPGLIRNHVRM
ncbi:hypothetical protein ASC89_02965 [Devosia sp. Root413D1]|uniref:glycosyltransferase family 2 protein n=1 Tax=Devosia sp. Root413D1 TaxID=1736531 RepID=UPI0006FE6C8B|nr:glycosyltransferase [Devosia sp. Root413D1]KQW86039.1 hypothetical protein ASC89_02965 [Devosia sp. Root413D1]